MAFFHIHHSHSVFWNKIQANKREIQKSEIDFCLTLPYTETEYTTFLFPLCLSLCSFLRIPFSSSDDRNLHNLTLLTLKVTIPHGIWFCNSVCGVSTLRQPETCTSSLVGSGPVCKLCPRRSTGPPKTKQPLSNPTRHLVNADLE